MVWWRCEMLVLPPGPAYEHAGVGREATGLWSPYGCAPTGRFHDQIDTMGLGERADTHGVDLIMQTRVWHGRDRCEVWVSALGRAFRRISDGSPGVDRCEIAAIALVRAIVRISNRSPAADPPRSSSSPSVGAFWLYERHFGPDLARESAVRSAGAPGVSGASGASAGT
jgi:hypothetical protein